jgi:hypothetical protein
MLDECEQLTVGVRLAQLNLEDERRVPDQGQLHDRREDSRSLKTSAFRVRWASSAAPHSIAGIPFHDVLEPLHARQHRLDETASRPAVRLGGDLEHVRRRTAVAVARRIRPMPRGTPRSSCIAHRDASRPGRQRSRERVGDRGSPRWRDRGGRDPPVRMLHLSPSRDRGLPLGYGRMPEAAVDDGVAALSGVLGLFPAAAATPGRQQGTGAAGIEPA